VTLYGLYTQPKTAVLLVHAAIDHDKLLALVKPESGSTVVFPGSTNPSAPANYASGIRGSYDIVKLAWQHSGEHSFSRVILYQSQTGSSAGGPFWDENGWPDGIISLAQTQGAREEGLGYDGEDFAECKPLAPSRSPIAIRKPGGSRRAAADRNSDGGGVRSGGARRACKRSRHAAVGSSHHAGESRQHIR